MQGIEQNMSGKYENKMPSFKQYSYRRVELRQSGPFSLSIALLVQADTYFMTRIPMTVS